jgi:hypothetical protein
MGGGISKKAEVPEIPDDLVDAKEVLDKVREAKELEEFKKVFEVNAKVSIERSKGVESKVHKDYGVKECEKDKKPVEKVKKIVRENLPKDKIKDYIQSKLSEKESYQKLPEKLREKALNSAVEKASDVLASKLVDRLLLEWVDYLMKPKEQQPEGEKKIVQTGGHVDGFMHVEAGKIAKKVGKNEFIFYTEILVQYKNVHPFVPLFYGPKEEGDKRYVVIQDLTHEYKKPCICDIKMGTSSVGEDASPEKKASMGAKDAATTTATLGIRLVGARVYQVDKDDYLQYDKKWGQALKDENFTENLAKFFHNGKEYVTEVIDPFLELLKPLEEWFDKQSELRFYSSSLLFIYDGHPDANRKDVRLKMIDFAHVHPIKDGGKDDGYILGLKNLRKQLNAVKSM